MNVFLLFGLFLTQGARSDQQLNVNVPAGGAQDLLNMTTIPPEISDSSRDSTVQRYCTNPSGRVIRQGQPGYQQCLELARGKKPTTQATTTPDSGIVIKSRNTTSE